MQNDPKLTSSPQKDFLDAAFEDDHAVLSTERTGMIATPPQSEAAMQSYQQICSLPKERAQHKKNQNNAIDRGLPSDQKHES